MVAILPGRKSYRPGNRSHCMTSIAAFTGFPAYSQILLRQRSIETLGPFMMFRSLSCDIDRELPALSNRPLPAYRYADRTVSSSTTSPSLKPGVQSLRILSVAAILFKNHPCDQEPFLLIVRTSWIFTANRSWRVPKDSRSFQHIARFIYVTTITVINQTLCSSNCYHSSAYSYGRRLPGLRSGASPCG